MSKTPRILSPLPFPAAVLAAGLLIAPLPAPAQQQTESRLSPLVVNPSAEPVGPSLRLTGERVDLATITREDSTLRVGSELVQGESVVTVRRQASAPAQTDDGRERRQQVIREQDDLRHKRISVIFDD